MNDKKIETESAYPHPKINVDDAGFEYIPASAGMTLRDYFAAIALQGILANDFIQRSYFKETAAIRKEIGLPENNNAAELHSWHASAAYQFADAMLAQRLKEPEVKNG